jgi:hypothetical protein
VRSTRRAGSRQTVPDTFFSNSAKSTFPSSPPPGYRTGRLNKELYLLEPSHPSNDSWPRAKSAPRGVWRSPRLKRRCLWGGMPAAKPGRLLRRNIPLWSQPPAALRTVLEISLQSLPARSQTCSETHQRALCQTNTKRSIGVDAQTARLVLSDQAERGGAVCQTGVFMTHLFSPRVTPVNY